MLRYFPQGLASDQSFCNRENEKKSLKTHMEAHEHIVLVAPRRYGKTSLITQLLKEYDFPNVNIDFFFVLSQTEVVKSITEGLSKLINDLLPKAKTASQKIINTIAELNPKITFNVLGQKLEIHTKQTTEKSISELLLALDQIAIQVKKSCVVVFDEFQQIGELKENHAVEAAIRHAVERSQQVSYIFCGSKRHLLHEMFSDKSRPLYHLCDLMTIDRIDSKSYHGFLNKMAKSKWAQILNDDVIDEILHLTENHPYYLNSLCRRLWHADSPPSLANVRNVWEEYVNQQSVWIVDDLSHLSLNRRKVLTALAYQPINEPQGQNFSETVGLNPSGIRKCLTDLQKMDMIFVDKNKYYHVFDPAIAYFIRKNR